MEHIVIDFDIKDENEGKSFEKNIKTVNKSGSGIHLHYIYNGDAERLDKRVLTKESEEE